MRRSESKHQSLAGGVPAIALLAGLFLACGSACSGAADNPEPVARTPLPADLDLVPRDAAGFVHIRAAELWQSTWAKDLRHIADQAGPEAWKQFEKKSPVNPATVDRITLILVSPHSLVEPFPPVDPESLSTLVLVRLNRPLDRLRLIQALGPREKVYRQHLYYFNEDLWSGLAVIDERTFVLGSEDALVRFFEMGRRKDGTGPLQAALAEAAGKHQVTVGLNPTLLGKEKSSASLPAPIRQLLAAHCGLVTVDLDEGVRVGVRFDYLQEDKAREGEQALHGTVELARQGLGQGITEMERVLAAPDKSAATDLPANFGALVGLGFLRELDTLLKEAPIRRQGLVVRGGLTYRKMESAPLLFASFSTAFFIGQSAVGAFQFVGQRVETGTVKDPIEEHLRNLGQALEKYREKHGTYPPPALHDKEGRPVLSWRVALLPYLGEEALYSEFRLDEPWDSLHNKRLLKKLPQALRSPSQPGWGTGRWKTVTQVFVGEDTLFAGKKGVRKSDVARPAIVLAHLNADAAVYWTKPADVVYAADQPLPNLFGKSGSRIQVLLADGTYRALDRSVEEKVLRGLIERGGDRPGAARKKDARSAGSADLEAVWIDFAQNDDAGTRRAWQDIAVLSRAPGPVVAFVRERVRPAPRPDPQRIARCLADLDSRNFKTRDRAMAELEALGELATPAIEKRFAGAALSAEARRRMEALVQKPKSVLSVADLRTVRAIEVLQRVGTAEARAVLEDLARGGEGTVVTEQARRAVAELARRSSGK